MSRRVLPACALVSVVAFGPGPAHAELPQLGCVVDSVRLSVVDEVEVSYVEFGVRLRASGSATATCTLDFTQVAFAAPEASGAATPTIAMASTWFSGKPVPPLLTADGVAAVSLRSWSGEVTATPTVVSARWILEGTQAGIRIELPRAVLPRLQHKGARLERRAKSPRPAEGRFDAVGAIEIPPSGPGLTGGIGPTVPLPDAEKGGRMTVELVPTGAPASQPISPAVRTLDVLRQTIPLRALDLSDADGAAWDELAKRAYAAALHGDPFVAALGMRTLAWLGSGLSLQAIRIAKVAAPPETALAPASVIDAIGDTEARLAKRHNLVGRFLPLGRPAVFRKVLEQRPWADAARAKAAKDAVARLAPLTPTDLAAYLMPAVLDGAALPIDPPQPAEAPTVVVPGGSPDDPVIAVDNRLVDKGLARGRGSARKRFGAVVVRLIVGAIVLALLTLVLREEPPTRA